MDRQPTPKVIGAFVIGFAMVAGAYVVSNFGKPPSTSPSPRVNVQTQQASLRTAIAVTDEDENGIEDWRDEFITTDPIIIEEIEDTPYQAPDTLTGQMSINFIQDMIRSRSFGPGGDDGRVIQQTISTLEQETSHPIYDTPDILLKSSNDGDAIRLYANAVASAIFLNSASDLDHELLILSDILNRGDASRIGELQELAETYRLTRDAILTIPVPSSFAKEHLDLINTLHAIHHDILGMTYTFDDPAYSLLRLQRYEDDVLGMQLALGNFYLMLEPHASLFTPNDPAVFFTAFNPSSRVRI